MLNSCCPAKAHLSCFLCQSSLGHIWGRWVKQYLFAFADRVCKCCGHAEARVLTVDEEAY